MVKDKEAWPFAVHGVAKSQTRLGNWTTVSFFPPEKHTLEFGSLVLQNVTFCGDLQRQSSENEVMGRGPLIYVARVLIKEKSGHSQICTEGRTTERKGERPHSDPSLTAPEGTQPVDIWVSGFFSFFFLIYLYSLEANYLQYCSGFCHTLTWISHGFTHVPHPEPPSHLPPHLIPLGHPSAPALSLVSCIKPGLAICFTHDNIHVSMLFSEIIKLLTFRSMKPWNNKLLLVVLWYSTQFVALCLQ